MDPSICLTTKQSPTSMAEHAIMRDKPYREAVGALNWATLTTRPDIAFAVTTVTHFAANPGPTHWEAVKRIFCYLSSTCDLWLTYRETKLALEGYANVDCSVMPQGLSYVPRVYLYLYSAIYVPRLAYVYHRTALPLIPDISTISILNCFRFTDTSWLTCLFGPHFSRSRCPSDSYLPLLFLARVSHFYSYDFNSVRPFPAS